jgi:hypothetical protein
MFGLPKRDWILAEVERVRERRRAQGHELTLLQEGMIAAIAAWDPRYDPSSAKIFDEITAAVTDTGRWFDQEEWRISTYFDSEIRKSERAGKPWFIASVSCDGQSFSCGCPTIEGAYAYVRLYQKIIVDQFYSVGPPWADNGKYRA